MHLSGLSIVYLLCAISLFGKSEKLLLAAVFFAPYMESFVFSTGDWNLKPGHFFLLLFLVTYFLTKIGKYKSKNSGITVKMSLSLTLFIFAAFLSILFSAIMHIDVPVYGFGNGVQLKSSLVSFQNFTQYTYIFTGWLMYICIYNYCANNPQFWDKLIKCMFISSCSILLIGLYQIIAVNFNLPYDEIFRQTSENGVRDMWQTKERISATFGEASLFGQYCTYVLAIYAYLFLRGKKKSLYIWTILFVILGILSRSTTFLIGSIAVIIIYMIINSDRPRNIIRYMMIFVVLIIAGITLYLFNPKVNEIVTLAINKFTLQNHSGEERFAVSKYMFLVGLKYPIFGIGYGGGRALNLYANIFSTTGIIGSICFWGYIIGLLFYFRNKLKDNKVKLCVLLLVGLLVTSISIPDINDLTLWCIFGLCDSYRYQMKHNIGESKNEFIS